MIYRIEIDGRTFQVEVRGNGTGYAAVVKDESEAAKPESPGSASLEGAPGPCTALVFGGPAQSSSSRSDAAGDRHALRVHLDSRVFSILLPGRGGKGSVNVNGRDLQVQIESARDSVRGARRGAGSETILRAVGAQMPGKILEVKVAPGQEVDRGATLLVIEAMKMENEVCSETSGRVETIQVKVGDSVEAGATLLVLAARD